jgi:RNA polymerase sigma factor (TIGR02999 family)
MADTSLTQRLQLFMQGDPSAADGVLREILPKLRQIALRELKDERHIAPVSPTELINELWIASLSSGGWQIRDQGHFFAIASLAMRRLLIDLARKRLAVFRGSGDVPLSLDDSRGLIGASVQDSASLVEIGVLMDQLDAEDPDAARIVDMRYFAGYTLEEIAKEMGLTLKQVRVRWNRGMKWLKRMLNQKAGGTSVG